MNKATGKRTKKDFVSTCEGCSLSLTFKFQNGKWIPYESNGKRHVCEAYYEHHSSVKKLSEEKMNELIGISDVKGQLEKFREDLDLFGKDIESFRLKIRAAEAENADLRRIVLDNKRLLDVLNEGLKKVESIQFNLPAASPSNGMPQDSPT